jgi:hypothetical protein
MTNHHQERLNELTARAAALGYRLVSREHDYLLWGIHQRRPIVATHSATTLDGEGGIADLLDGIARFPSYCLQLQGNPRVQVVAQANGQRIVRDTSTGEFFKLRADEHQDATTITVHAKYSPPIGNWSTADG